MMRDIAMKDIAMSDIAMSDIAMSDIAMSEASRKPWRPSCDPLHWPRDRKIAAVGVIGNLLH